MGEKVVYRRKKNKVYRMSRKEMIILCAAVFLSAPLVGGVINGTQNLLGWLCEKSWNCEGCNYSNWAQYPPYNCSHCGKSA
jgi:hypothetical protein